MNANKAAELDQDSPRQETKRHEPHRQVSDLDTRYGKIGISAVAAAVRHRSERHVPAGVRSVLQDRD